MLFKVTYDKEIHILKSQNAKTLQELKGSVPKVFKQHPQNFYLTYLDEDGDEITLATEADYEILVGGGVKSAKILIKQKNEDFYDETQKIDLEEQIPSEIEAMVEKDIDFNNTSEIRQHVQDMSIDESIEEKIKNMLPDIITKIKTEVQEEIMSQSRLTESSKQPDSTFEESKPKVVHPHIICDGCGANPVAGNRYKCAICNDYDLCEKCEAKSDHPHPFLKIKHPRQRPLKIIVVMRDEEDSFQVNGQRHQMNGLSELIAHGANFVQQFTRNLNVPRPQEKKEEKTEEKVEPKVEVKPEPTVQQKMPRKTEEKKVEVVEAKEVEEPKREEPVVQKVEVPERKEESREHAIIEGANYLSEMMNISFTRGYRFAGKYPMHSKEQLLELYLSQLQ